MQASPLSTKWLPMPGINFVMATKYRRLVEVKLSPGTFREELKSNCSTGYSIRARALSQREDCGKGCLRSNGATRLNGSPIQLQPLPQA